MPSKLNAYLLSAAMLLCALGAPVENELNNSEAGDTSGEESREGTSEGELLSNSEVWRLMLGMTVRHQQEFEGEFQNVMKYRFLDNYKVPSPPSKCPKSNFSKEACLHRLAEGLYTYMVLLKYVEKEYPNSSILSVVRHHSGSLMELIKGKMRNRELVKPLDSSQEEQLLKELDNPDAYHRKMTAHQILRQLHHFLRDSKVEIAKREQSRRNVASKIVAPTHSYHQLLHR
ncbi:interleukin-6 [Toxotes jaculatrix]|uniref:interleukin-6 n=1 Tax=Toxotes jaculatrix TaxID=941984 RepID=UPI001B3B0020|nr:interleukin-6 [Toxotes jaculatrix]